jgi:hypothetical protein
LLIFYKARISLPTWPLSSRGVIVFLMVSVQGLAIPQHPVYNCYPGGSQFSDAGVCGDG